MKWNNLINWPNGEVGVENRTIGEGAEFTGFWIRATSNMEEEVTPLCPRCEAEIELAPADSIGGFRVTCACEQPPNIEIPVKDD
jgi:hypothetical protein